jgi:hypothetical protein
MKTGCSHKSASHVKCGVRNLTWLLLLVPSAQTDSVAQQLPNDDVIRIREFYRMTGQIQDKIWPKWSAVPAPLLLVAGQAEFLTHHPAPPKDFNKIGEDVYARPRQFPANLLATFPAFGPPSVIVIGEPASTSKTSTPWLITLMHEHFHQLQNAQPGYFEGVDKLGLSRGDNSGMWMLNYPFPYDSPSVVRGFVQLRDLLVRAMSGSDPKEFARDAADYSRARKAFFAQLSTDDHKYLAFQLWQEGISRYTEIRAAAAAAAEYQPTPEYRALPDFESFAEYSKKLKAETLEAFRSAEIGKEKRLIVYAWGAEEGFLLSRLDAAWQDEYFKHPFSLDFFFEK